MVKKANSKVEPSVQPHVAHATPDSSDKDKEKAFFLLVDQKVAAIQGLLVGLDIKEKRLIIKRAALASGIDVSAKTAPVVQVNSLQAQQNIRKPLQGPPKKVRTEEELQLMAEKDRCFKLRNEKQKALGVTKVDPKDEVQMAYIAASDNLRYFRKNEKPQEAPPAAVETA